MTVITGKHVIYQDHIGSDHDALVTAISGVSANLVIVTSDPQRTDPYGLQIIRLQSVPHISVAGLGISWREP